MRRLTAYAVAAMIVCASAIQGGEVFTYGPTEEFAEHHILPRMNGKWLLLGCDSILSTGIRLTSSGDHPDLYKIKAGRKLPESVAACNREDLILVRNIAGVRPGALPWAVEDSIDDSTRSYRTGTDTVAIVTTHATDGLALEFASGSRRQTLGGKEYESVQVPFAGDINKDGRIDFVILWISTYAIRYDVLVSRKIQGVWGWEQEAQTVFTD